MDLGRRVGLAVGHGDAGRRESGDLYDEVDRLRVGYTTRRRRAIGSECGTRLVPRGQLDARESTAGDSKQSYARNGLTYPAQYGSL